LTHSRGRRNVRRGWRFCLRWGIRNNIKAKEELPEGKIECSGNLGFFFDGTMVYDLLLAVEIVSISRCKRKLYNSLSPDDLTVLRH